MIKKFLKHLGLCFLSLILLMFLVLTNLQMVVFNNGFYAKEYEKYSIVEQTGIKKNQLLSATNKLLNYLRGHADNPQSIVTIEEKERPLFGNRELLHLSDVRELFKKGFLIKNLTFGMLGSALILFILVKPLRNRAYKIITLSALYALIGLFCFGSLVFLSFNTCFTYFHMMFFDNDLWLLDPSKEYLVRMFPEGFFLDSAVKVFVYTVVELLLLIAVFKALKYLDGV
ncbi:MAG: hypothetical protein PWQ82_1140 [Thermosediminibacterales bacterium]|nr:hypothetical protein [Thermosediminibacterales bacterium]MDK2835666.1 hypothetical protein [Thermosediminibacterales bacterium]